MGRDVDIETVRESQRQDAEHKRRVEIDDIQWLMGDKRGRRIVRRLLSACGVYRTSFSPGSPDGSAFNEGRRNVGLEALAEVTQHAPEAFVLMQEEGLNVDRRKRK